MVDRRRSSVLRRKFLQKGYDLTLEIPQIISRVHEAADSQFMPIESKNIQGVNLVSGANKHKQ